MLQSLQILYPNNNSLEHRNRITSEEIISPLELLYEFGEMESVHGNADPVTRPVLFFDSDSIEFGSAVINQNKKKVLGNSIYCVIEACEPSVGLRSLIVFYSFKSIFYYSSDGVEHTSYSAVRVILC